MITLTLQERAIWLVLRDLASNRSTRNGKPTCVSYLELSKQIDPVSTWHYPMTRPPFRGLNEALGHVSMYEVEHGRPMLTALVVNADTRKPGPGFTRLAQHLGRKIIDPDEFWQEELSRVISFWGTEDQVLVIDTAIDQVLNDLTSVKRQLRQIIARLEPQ